VGKAFLDSFFEAIFCGLVIASAFGEVGLGDIGSLEVVTIEIAFSVA